jgi:hypothetical protein
MKLSQSVVAVAFGLGLLSAGCIAPGDATEAAGLDAPSFETLDGPEGGGNQNGLKASDFHANKWDLRTAAGVKVFETAPAVNTAIINTGLFAATGGNDAFEYMVKCGVSQGTPVTSPTRPFLGGGLLDTTSGWTSAGLGLPEQEDLFTCVTALMNAYGQEVPIVLTGPSIHKDGGDYTDYTYVEAVWLTELDSSGGFLFSVWPREYLKKKCGTNTSAWINLRICGDLEANCGVHVYDTFEEDCVDVGVDDEEGMYTCNGKPAIQTWLPSDYFHRLYDGCEPPPQ